MENCQIDAGFQSPESWVQDHCTRHWACFHVYQGRLTCDFGANLRCPWLEFLPKCPNKKVYGFPWLPCQESKKTCEVPNILKMETTPQTPCLKSSSSWWAWFHHRWVKKSAEPHLLKTHPETRSVSFFVKLEAFKHSTFITLRTFGSISFKEMKPVFSVSSSPQIPHGGGVSMGGFHWIQLKKHKEMHTSGNIMTSLHLATSNNKRPSQPWTFASFPWSPSAGNDDWTHLGDPETSRRKVGITVKVRMDEWTNVEILQPFWGSLVENIALCP